MCRPVRGTNALHTRVNTCASVRQRGNQPSVRPPRLHGVPSAGDKVWVCVWGGGGREPVCVWRRVSPPPPRVTPPHVTPCPASFRISLALGTRDSWECPQAVPSFPLAVLNLSLRSIPKLSPASQGHHGDRVTGGSLMSLAAVIPGDGDTHTPPPSGPGDTGDPQDIPSPGDTRGVTNVPKSGVM